MKNTFKNINRACIFYAEANAATSTPRLTIAPPCTKYKGGSSDFFFQVNKNLHEKLLERNIPHDFTVRPGGHSWEYWSNSINYQVLFFSRFFNKSK